MRLVVQACPDMAYSVILTQVSPEEIKEAGDSMVAILQELFPPLKVQPAHTLGMFHVIMEEDTARKKKNVLLSSLAQDSLRKFILTAPSSMVRECKPIVSTEAQYMKELEETKALLAKTVAEVKAQKDRNPGPFADLGRALGGVLDSLGPGVMELVKQGAIPIQPVAPRALVGPEK